MTGREAVETVEREAAAAEVVLEGPAATDDTVRRLVIEALDKHPGAIVTYLAACREEIAKRAM